MCVQVYSCFPPTFSGFMRQPLQASVMKPRVSMSGRRPKAAVGSGGPPTWTTQQLMLWPRIRLTEAWRAPGEGNPQIPSVSKIRPVCAVCACVWCVHVWCVACVRCVHVCVCVWCGMCVVCACVWCGMCGVWHVCGVCMCVVWHVCGVACVCMNNQRSTSSYQKIELTCSSQY